MEGRKIFGNIVKVGLIYALVCVLGNFFVTASPRKRISVEQAESLVRSEQEYSGKKINFTPTSHDSLPPEVLGMVRSYHGEYYIIMDSSSIDKKVLLHEIAHTKISEPNTARGTFNFSAYRKECKQRSILYYIPYVFSPKELFCNLYALEKSFIR